ncbi:MAG: hypothetical protein ACOH5I_04710 [Oligoflexus sp.]
MSVYYSTLILFLACWLLVTDRRLVAVMFTGLLVAQALLPWLNELMVRMQWTGLEILLLGSLLFHGLAILRTLVLAFLANKRTTTDELQLMRG